MPHPLAVPAAVLALLERQDGVVTTAQARDAGLTVRRIRTLLGHGWTRPLRGVLAAPAPRDPFRSAVRAALLACPGAVVAGLTAARLYQLEGLPRWTPDELPQLLLPVGCTYDARQGVRLRSGLRTNERTVRGGIPVTTLARTVRDMALVLSGDELVCLVDSVLRARWVPVDSCCPGQPALRLALSLADKRSESTFETQLRLLFVREGVAPESLQWKVCNEAGREIARLDFAWPSLKLAVEADGRGTHDAPAALYRDRSRANEVGLEGWLILRFTWRDLKHRPEWIVAQVRHAINRLVVARSAA